MSGGESIVGLGLRSDFVAAVPNADSGKLKLTPQEVALFLQVGRASRIGDLIAGSNLPEPIAISLLLSLRMKGAIVPARVKAAEPAAQVSVAMAEEVELDPARKKEILDLERIVDSGNHFEVLGLRPGTAAEDVKKAFYEASRRYHPDRYFGKNLGSFRARVERIFKRLSEAHQVLTDTRKRTEYLQAHPELSSPPPEPPAPERPRTEADEQRDKERRSRFARHPYLAKQARTAELVARARALIAEGDHAKAYTDLHLATQIDDKNLELKELLAQTRKNADLQRAKAELERGDKALAAGDKDLALKAFQNGSSLDPTHAGLAARVVKLLTQEKVDPKEIKLFAQRAVDGEPKSADHRVALATVLQELGMKEAAKRQFEEALKLNPEHAEARKHVKKRWPF